MIVENPTGSKEKTMREHTTSEARGPRQRATNEQIIQAYQNTGSVWRAADQLGMSGQTVHARLKALGQRMGTGWTEDEVDRLRELAGAYTIGSIADTLGRSYASIACKLNEIGVSGRGDAHVSKKIPRGQGYDKRSVARYIKELDATDERISAFARRNGLRVESLVRAVERNFPEWWHKYRETHTDLPEKACPYCGTTFFPSNKRQVYCSRKCREYRAKDESYFGGNKRSAIGWDEQTCQVCERTGIPGLSVHHYLGKEHDPENHYLITVCRGCHQIITMLGARTWTREQWEAIITLSVMRKQGAEFAEKERVLEVFVDLDVHDYDPEEDADVQAE